MQAIEKELENPGTFEYGVHVGKALKYEQSHENFALDIDEVLFGVIGSSS